MGWRGGGVFSLPSTPPNTVLYHDTDSGFTMSSQWGAVTWMLL